VFGKLIEIIFACASGSKRLALDARVGLLYRLTNGNKIRCAIASSPSSPSA